MLSYIRNKKGFTLVEIIVVLVIIAILAVTMLPALTGYIDDAREKSAISEGRTVLVAAQTIASQMRGNGIVETAIETQIMQVNTPSDIKYPCIKKLTGMKLTEGAVTAADVNTDGTVTTFKLTASNGKNITYGFSDGFTMGS